MKRRRLGSSTLFILVDLDRKPNHQFFTHIAQDTDLLQILLSYSLQPRYTSTTFAKPIRRVEKYYK